MSQANRRPVIGLQFGVRPSRSLLNNRRMWGGILLGFLVFASPAVHPAQAQSGPPGSGWVLTFDDEFNGNSLDLSKWSNFPLTNYWQDGSKSDLSAAIEDNGVLQLMTYLTDPNGPVTASNTTAGAIWTPYTFTQQYGWWEFRCKMGPGAGMDEGLEMYGASVAYQDIDVPEWLGNTPNTLWLAHHWGPAESPTNWNLISPKGPDWSADFHTYAVNWQPDSITFYVDGIQYYQVTDNVPQVPMYIVISSGSGGPGNWGGDINASTCPNSMVIDYVRVYQGGGTTPPVPPPPPPPPPPNGSVLYPGQGGSLVTSEGTWTFGGVSSDGVDYYTDLNGVVVGWAAEMEIVGGSLYAYNTVGGHWFLWQNGTWVDLGTNTPPSPPPPPNGSVLYPGQGGSLVTSDGTWTFGDVSSDGVDYYTDLNGVVVGWAAEMEIVGGSLYAHNTVGGHWFLWQNGTWVDMGTTAPSSPSLSPNGSILYPGQGGSLVTAEGTWTFGGVSTDVGNYYTDLNGVAVGWAAEMEIVSGSLYAHNTVGGDWFLWQNGTWVDIGPTAP